MKFYEHDNKLLRASTQFNVKNGGTGLFGQNWNITTKSLRYGIVCI